MTIRVYEFCAYYKRELFFLLRNAVAEGIWVNSLVFGGLEMVYKYNVTHCL
jgi:hypothetical protein